MRYYFTRQMIPIWYHYVRLRFTERSERKSVVELTLDIFDVKGSIHTYDLASLRSLSHVFIEGDNICVRLR